MGLFRYFFIFGFIVSNAFVFSYEANAQEENVKIKMAIDYVNSHPAIVSAKVEELRSRPTFWNRYQDLNKSISNQLDSILGLSNKISALCAGIGIAFFPGVAGRICIDTNGNVLGLFNTAMGIEAKAMISVVVFNGVQADKDVIGDYSIFGGSFGAGYGGEGYYGKNYSTGSSIYLIGGGGAVWGSITPSLRLLLGWKIGRHDEMAMGVVNFGKL